MKGTRILVADEQDVVRAGVRAILEAHGGWEVCGEAATGREAVVKARQLKPHILLADVSLPELNGLDAARQILKFLPKLEVLIYTSQGAEDVVREALEIGARAYVMKSDPKVSLVGAVSALQQHKPFFGSAISETLLDNYLSSTPRPERRAVTRSNLSAREREVIQLLAEGKSNKEVAAALGISIKTAETHRTNIMHKLRLHSITQVVRFAIRNKLIAP